MSKLYFKIFLSFWLVMILTVVSSSFITHWFNLGADKHLVAKHDDPFDGPGGRLLREIVSNAVNFPLEEVTHGLQQMPEWAIESLYILDETGEDVLRRPLPETVATFSGKVTDKHPFYRKRLNQYTVYVRQIQLIDGHRVKLIATPPNDNSFGWKLFFNNAWIFLLTCILITGLCCYFIARYMSRDFNTIKKATMSLAEGDWNARISDGVCSGHTEFSKLARNFNYMADNLQKSMLEQKRLIKDVSHELRSPLARLQVALAIVQQKANDEIKDELFRIKDAADYLNDVISNILSLPINDQQSWQLDDVVELNSMLSLVVDQNRPEADDKQVNVIFRSKLDEAIVMSRSNTLVGVFDNVLRNAVHYTAEATTIDVLLDQCGENYCIRFQDQGPGVPEENLKGIFKPFFRTCEARNRESGGYGLGLAIAERTIKLHHGTISAKNVDPTGLEVEINLPRTNLDE
ncbi:MAG: ATP-binding protein [Candidatus Pelagadaptatus aseana]|uniref:ATP-binding protein n=1 Tax=Candidatus Pelagadaptatus aseana TaxID=3120508 RepID=UPI0039B2F4EE